jgi:hypothetical protein
VTESFEDSAVGRFIRSAKAFAAEVEHEKIKERTGHGRVARAHSGKLIPGWKALYGYRWADDAGGRYVTAEPEATVVRRIFAASAQGQGLVAIAAELMREGVPTPSGRAPVWRTSTLGTSSRRRRTPRMRPRSGSTIHAARTTTSEATAGQRTRSSCQKAPCPPSSMPRRLPPCRSAWP